MAKQNPTEAVTEFLAARAKGKKPEPVAFEFTLTALKKLPVDTKEYSVIDSYPNSNLRCRVRPSGARTLIVQGVVHGTRKTAKVRICNVGGRDQMSLKAARKKGADELATLQDGKNPNAERRKKRAEQETEGTTLGAAWELLKEQAEIRPSTLADYTRALEVHLADWLEKPVTEITGMMVEDRYMALKKDGKHHRAAKCMQALRRVYTNLNSYHETDSEPEPFGRPPTWKVNKRHRGWADPGERDRYLESEEIGPWLRAVRSLPDVQERGNGQDNADFLELAVLTALRRNELARLPWADVDFRRGTLTITADRAKNHHALVLPLTRRVTEILKRRHKARGKDQTVFNLVEIKRAVAKIEALTGLRIMPHDCRRSWASIADEKGVSVYTVKACMNHRPGKDVTNKHYVPPTLTKKRDALQKVEDWILAQAEGGKVIKLPGTA